MTYSIAAYDSEKKEWGVAVQTCYLAVGSLVPWVKAGIGAVATQALTNASYGKKAFKLLEEGKAASQVVERLIAEDEDREKRQLGIVDSQGRTAGYTGKDCFDWAGREEGNRYTCQGNMLWGEDVIKSMALTYENSSGDLAHRLLAALKAAQRAGGDRRGRQSAALLIKKEGKELKGDYDTLVDLRIDDHQTPVQELERLLQLHRVKFALNHRERYYSFEGETRHQIAEMLQTIGFIDRPLQDGKVLEDILIRYGLSRGFDQNKIFRGNNINGELVFQLVSSYGEWQSDRLK